jgi:hypothetical protein
MPFIKHETQAQDACRHPEHNPPTGVVLAPGRHTYQCPSCKAETAFTVDGIIC